MCVLFASSTSGIVFKPSAGAITYHSQTAKDRGSSMQRTPATESRYSFNRIDRENPDNLQKLFLPWVDLQPRPLD